MSCLKRACRRIPFAHSARCPASFSPPLRLARGPPQKEKTPLTRKRGHFQASP
jgi:hypothetical protein